MQRSQQNLTDYNAIDLAKFICAILVVMVHVVPFGSSSDTKLFIYLNYGLQQYLARIAVPFYFVCSGFFLYKKTSQTDFSFKPTQKYAVRLLRLYITWTLIYLPLSFRLFLRDERGFFYAVLVYMRNLVITGSHTHLWYLNATIFAVMLTSLLLYKNIQPSKIITIAFVLYFVGLFAQSWFGFIVPIKELFPPVWNFLKILQKIMVTTRNGLFDGFLFVSIGMIFAYYDLNISKKKAILGFIVSMLLLFVEVFILKYFDYVRSNDMYLFLVPATFFCFSFVSQIKLCNNPIYKSLRMLSSLIFYLHLWFCFVVDIILQNINELLPKTWIQFFLTLVFTVIGSMLIMKLSETDKFRWLKKLYM